MDGKLYYQPILIDTHTNDYRTIPGARKFATLWEAEEQWDELAETLNPLPQFQLGVQEVRSTPMPGHKPVNDYKQGE